MSKDDDEIFEAECDEINELISDSVWPILTEIEEQYPDHSAFFAIFIDSIHMLLYQGWTVEELMQEVKDHHEIFMKNEHDDFTGTCH